MLVVLDVQFDLQAAQGVDFFSGNLRAVGHGHAIYGSAAGHGADDTNLESAFSGGCSAQAQCHCQGKHGRKQFTSFHFGFLLV